ncbi:MAG: hypothetical protein OXC46_02495 [Thaumarchaeota archaeon]|nr:hypothetical protein [Nitrososphaerota archaeon]
MKIIQLYEINEELIDDILDRTSILEDYAVDTNLNEPLDITMKYIDIDVMKRLLKELKMPEYENSLDSSKYL